MSPAIADRPVAAVAGGLLLAHNDLDEAADVKVTTQRLQAFFNRSALWVDGSHTVHPIDADQGTPPRWVPPPASMSEALAEKLEAAWTAVLAERDLPDHPVLRLRVDDDGSAAALARMGAAGGVILAPSVDAESRRFVWHWPLAVVIADGPHADSWLAELNGDEFAGDLFDVRSQSSQHDLEADTTMLIVDAEATEILERVRSSNRIACVVVVGDSSTGVEGLLEQARSADAAIAVGVEADDVSWFSPLLEELSHDQPLDVALRRVEPEARIAGNYRVLGMTAVRPWATELHQVVHEQQDAVDLDDLVTNAPFDHERMGARAVADAVRELDDAGIDTAVELPMTAAAEPPDDGIPATGEAVRRELLIKVNQGDTKCTTALRPETEHLLLVRIAQPGPDDDSGIAFREAELPLGDGTADLVANVSSSDGSIHGSAPMVISTEDRTKASTVARIAFRTGDENTLLDLKVTILHLGRPIQAARVVASVRAVPVAEDVVQILPLRLSTDPEPRDDTTEADATVDATHSTIYRVGRKDQDVELANLPAIIQLFDTDASKILGHDDAPSTFTDPRSRELIVKLARHGDQWRRKIKRLRLDDARVIAVTVRRESEIIPFELAYDGPIPDEDAALCDHVDNPPPAGEPCTKSTKQVACPYAFWGSYRTVARTVESEDLGGAIAARPRVEALSLRPVLYAAANKADVGHTRNKPSALLKKSLDELAGGPISRVKDWDAWREAVTRQPPQMMVVLAHTAFDNGAPALVIGAKSSLPQSEIDPTVLGRVDSPAPVVLLIACSTVVAGDVFGTLPGALVEGGAAAVVATLTKLTGADGAHAGASVARALFDASGADGVKLGTALTSARRELLKGQHLVGLLLVAHGEIDVKIQ